MKLRPRFAPLRGVFAVLLLLPTPALASSIWIDFENAVPPFTDAATVAFPGVDLSPATLLDEASAALVTGFDTSEWAASGTQGLLNSLAPTIAFDFTSAVSDFSIEIVGLPSGGGAFESVRLDAFAGAALVDSVASNPADIDPVSGFHEASLGVSAAAIDRVVVSGATNPGVSLTFWLDDAHFTPVAGVPEPSAALLFLVGFGVLSRVSRRGVR